MGDSRAPQDQKSRGSVLLGAALQGQRSRAGACGKASLLPQDQLGPDPLAWRVRGVVGWGAGAELLELCPRPSGLCCLPEQRPGAHWGAACQGAAVPSRGSGGCLVAD